MAMLDYLTMSVRRPETRLLAMISGLWMSRLVGFAVRHGIIKALAEDRSAGEVAAATSFLPDVTERLLDGLAHLGLVERKGDAYALTDDGRLLLPGKPGGFAAMATLWSELFDGAWSALDETARTGVPGFQVHHGQPIFAKLGSDPAIAATFDVAMRGLAGLIADEVARHVARRRHALICDVGGGDGLLLGRILAEAPGMSGILFDRPDVAERARSANAATDRITVCGGDFFDAVPEAPAHILSNIIHDWPDDDAIRILSNVRAAQPADGRLYLVEMMLGGESEPLLARSTDLNMLMLTGGRERTHDTFGILLSQAGYEIEHVDTVADLTCLIAARPTTKR
jgi:hypothetical protein